LISRTFKIIMMIEGDHSVSSSSARRRPPGGRPEEATLQDEQLAAGLARVEAAVIDSSVVSIRTAVDLPRRWVRARAHRQAVRKTAYPGHVPA
jgi:hypothetical protein